MRASPFVLAASAEMLFLDRPVADRVRAIRDAGFAVEIWDWRNHDLDTLEALAADGVVFTSMTGYTTGTLADDAGADELLRTAAESVVVSRRLGAPSLNLHGTGLDGRGLPVAPTAEVTPAMWDTARRTLGRIAELGAREGVTFVLENLNTAVDHPGTPFARAADTLDLVREVDSPHLRLNLDLYHAQIGEGNLVELCREALPWIGEVQVADVPGRCEPGTGEIRYAGVAAALADAGYTGVVGLEAFASGDPDAALAAFREAFTVC
jgi:hydroxypyruvate isomerase